MKFIYCVEEKNGILFGNKRVSRDEEVIKDILSDLECEPLWIKEDSKILFENYLEKENINIVDEFDFNQDGTFFIEEDLDYIPEELVVYNWCRHYPATTFFKLDLDNDFERMDKDIFEGKSHEKIVKKIYRRKTNG